MHTSAVRSASLACYAYGARLGFTYNFFVKWGIPIVLLATNAIANDGWWAATGEMGGFGKNDQIQMVEERIDIRLGTESAQVTVDFVFKNHGPAVIVTMGFPEEHAGPMDRGMRSFTSTVDGVPQDVRKKILDQDDERRHWSVVWLKDVDFEVGQSRKVRVAYEAQYHGNTGGELGLTYIMRTGSTWRGPLESCEISVDWSARDRGPPLIRFTDDDPIKAKAWRRVARDRCRATLTDIEPDFDLSISFAKKFWNFEIDGARVSTEAFCGASDRRDPRLRTDYSHYVASFFGAEGAEGWEWWEHPAIDRLGGEFEIRDGKVVFADGRTAPLARGTATGKNWRGEVVELVYVKDLAEALGGSYITTKSKTSGALTYRRSHLPTLCQTIRELVCITSSPPP